MSADLIERLFAWGQNSPDPDYFQGDILSSVLSDCALAADALAAKEAALSEMRAELERVKDYHRNCSDEAQRLLAEKHDLLAELALARKALEPFGRENDLPKNLPDSTHLGITFAGQLVAHATFGDFRAAARSASQDEGEER